jgi:F420-non-reducing hydrogenase small subunit
LTKSKLKLAIGLGATCSGCDIAILDLGEKLVDVFNSFDIVFWPTMQDQKLDQLKDMPDGSIDVALYHGSLANSENLEIAELLRKKSKMLIAFGACACIGGIPGLANTTTASDLLETVYKTTISTSNPDGTIPSLETKVRGHVLALPQKFDTVSCLSEVVDVDYYLPGCPPETELVEEALKAIASDNLPPRGAVLAPDRILCDECPRKREDKKISTIYRHHEVTPDPEKCLLDQGILCMGIATRAGCGAKCIAANIPCRGCMGPTSKVFDQGAKAVASLASIIGLEGEEQMSDADVKRLMDQIRDPLGIFYMFSLPSSILKRTIVKMKRS